VNRVESGDLESELADCVCAFPRFDAGMRGLAAHEQLVLTTAFPARFCRTARQ
jgi:hypothetical protein